MPGQAVVYPLIVTAWSLSLGIAPPVSAPPAGEPSPAQEQSEAVETPAEPASTDPAPAEAARTEPARRGSVPDPVWDALRGRQVVVTRTDGSVISGELADHDESVATLIAPDGRPIVVPKTEAADARANVSAQPAQTAAHPTQTYPATYGRHRIGWGITLMVGGGVSSALAITGFVIGSFAIILGIGGTVGAAVGFGVGIPLYISGRKRKALRGQPMRVSLAPLRIRGGHGGALTLRF